MLLEDLNRRNSYVNDIKGIQFISFQILREFDRICRKYNIEYWLDSGTLLGAVRHKGFIPWDDDIDVCIAKKDEKKLCEVLKKELPYYLFLTNEPVKKGEEKLKFYKIRDRYSSSYETLEEERQTGIWIDIFIMNEIKSNKLISYLIKNCPTNIENKEDKNIKKYVRKLLFCILKLFKIKDKSDFKKKYYCKLTKKCVNKDSLIYMEGEMCWQTYNKEWVYPLRELEFEGYKFLVPNEYDKYLRSYYGNYMKLPPLDKRRHHWIKFDIFSSNDHPESLKWEEREMHYQKYVKERERK